MLLPFQTGYAVVAMAVCGGRRLRPVTTTARDRRQDGPIRANRLDRALTIVFIMMSWFMSAPYWFHDRCAGRHEAVTHRVLRGAVAAPKCAAALLGDGGTAGTPRHVGRDAPNPAVAAVEKGVGRAAGAVVVKEPQKKPWGQLVGYVRDNNGFLVEICAPMDA